MVIVKIQGGLGNQMFQYALYCKLKHIYKTVKVDVSWYQHNRAESQRKLELQQFPIRLNVCSNWNKFFRCNTFTLFASKHLGLDGLFYREKASGVYCSEIFKKRNALLDGYWQSEQYFSDIREQVLQEFAFPKSITEYEEAILERIKTTIPVSIHVRRGDYLKNSDKYGNICTEQYYHMAIQYMKKKLINPSFFVFSDDINERKL